MPFLASESLLRVVTAKQLSKRAFTTKRKQNPDQKQIATVYYSCRFPNPLAGVAAAAAGSPALSFFFF